MEVHQIMIPEIPPFDVGVALSWLETQYTQGKEPDRWLLDLYINYGGSLEILKLIVERSNEILDSYLFTNVAKNCDLECVQFLHSKGCPYSQMTIIQAAKEKHFDVLQFFLLNGYEVPMNIVLKILCDHGMSDEEILKIVDI